MGREGRKMEEKERQRERKRSREREGGRIREGQAEDVQQVKIPIEFQWER